ncbi:MAG: small subunit ribosomal protein S4 [Urechidicola sp.]|jgi:small subunit ribosomal protein S4|tara:strand:- start:7204 stop:7809 length:606 start_codon:yes stop_codon:yes gene_type:complete
MARYTGPKSRIARRFNEAIFGPDKNLEKRQYGPGQHGPNKRRPKQSEYGIQLMEKQKAKYTYGILEKQFRNMYKKAKASNGITGEELLQLCERRLDNVVFRFGISNTRSGARQFVSHRHITVNGEVLNIPSYMVKEGDVIGVREKSKSNPVITASLSSNNRSSDWLEWDSIKMSGRFIKVPERVQIPENIKEQLIVELYSK